MKERKLNCGLIMLAVVALASAGAVRAGDQVGKPVPVPAAPAKFDGPIRLTPAQAGVFRDALAALSQQGHVTIVAEGAPLHPVLSLDKASDLSIDAPLEPALKTLAAAYDYDVQRQGQVYLLRKRYTDPQDLPGVTLEECSQAVQDVLDVLRPFAVDTRFPIRESALDSILPQLAASFTPEQTRALQGNTLAFATLDPSQQGLVRRFALFFYDQQVFEPAQMTALQLKQAPQAAFTIDTPRSGTFFGYLAKRLDGRVGFTGFTQTFLSEGSGPIIDPDATLPPNWKFLQKEWSTGAATTLGQEVASLNARGGHMTVDAALQAKPVSIAGDENAGPNNVLQAMADVYGLRVKIKGDGTRQLTRQWLLIPRNVTGLPEAIWNTLPGPLQRAIHKDGRATLAQEAARIDMSRNPAAWQQYLAHQNAYTETPKSLHTAAVQRLRIAVEPFWVKDPSRKPVPVSALSEADRQAFAVALMTDLMSAARAEYGRPVPDYITNIDQSILRGSFVKDEAGRPMLAFNLAIPNADGSGVHDGPGTLGVPYSPPQ